MKRRDALKTGVAVAVTASLGFPAMAKGDDSELLALEAEFQKTARAALDMDGRVDDLTKKLPAWTRGNAYGIKDAEGPHIPPDDAYRLLESNIKKVMDYIGGWFDGDAGVMDAVNGFHEGKFALLEKHSANIEAIRKERGIITAEKEAAQLWKRVEKIADKIVETPANGPQGIAVQLRLDDPDVDSVVSALEDAKRLAGGAA